MKTEPIARARHVFLGGNDLPARWAGHRRFVVLDTGFGCGDNFLATWQAWAADPQRCRQLVYIGIEPHAPTRDDLVRAHGDSPWPRHAAALQAAWPPRTPDLHPLDFEHGRVRLLLALGGLAEWLAELALHADAFYLDGAAAWDRHLLRALGRRAAAGATAAACSATPALREGLVAAGFDVTPQAAAGIGETIQARYRPRFAVRTPPPAPGRREAIVVGAGLAGASVAHALVDEGWSVTVFDRRATPAAETSGNAGGLFHGTVHADDGVHARLLRAAALQAERVLRPLVDTGLPGQVQGLLRLDTRGTAAMQAVIERRGLPGDWVQALDVDAASRRAGVALPAAAWFYPGAGWVAPAALVGRWLQAEALRFVGGVDVQSVQRDAGGWRLLDRAGRTLAAAPVVVLATAGDAARLLAADWPLQRSRGQVSGWAGPPTPLALPVAGDGYALPLPGGGLLCGASSHEGDDDAAVRDSDHAENFERLQRLTGLRPPADRSTWLGRTGWRVVAADRLPIAGPMPRAEPGTRQDQARLWPREPGLFVCTALGGRGITLAPLLGRLLAAQIAGSPLPLPQSLVDAVDPVRWRVRAARREGA